VGKKGKKYGLIKPKLSIFAADDDDDKEDNTPADYNYLKYRKQKVKKQREEALAQDPTVFQYDEVFDSLQDDKADKAKAVKKEKRNRKSRYIENLIKKSKEREIEQAIIEERVLLKEREREDDEFGNKEKFVTSAYKKALKERKLWLKERERLDAIDEAKAQALREGGSLGGGLMSHLLSARSTAGAEEKETTTIRERVKRVLDEKEKKDQAEKKRKREENLLKREKVKKQRTLEDIAKAAVSRYDNLDTEKEMQSVMKVVAKAEKSGEDTEASKKPVVVKKEEKVAEKPKEQSIVKRNVGEKLMSAKERYLARKRAKAKLAEKLGK